MYVHNILSNIKQEKNQTIYGQDMYRIYTTITKELYSSQKTPYDNGYGCIYIDTQTDKEIVLAALNEIKDIDENKLRKIPQEKLLKILIATLPDKKLIIVYNYLEDISNRREQLFKRLMRNKVLFVAGFQKLPNDTRMPFFDMHEFVNKSYFESQKGENNIDITYFFYIFITFFMVLMFLRIISLGAMGDILSSALWFGLLIFRTFSYIGGKV